MVVMNKKNIVKLICIVVILILVVIGIYFVVNNQSSDNDFRVLDNLSDIQNDKNEMIKNEDGKFYTYENEGKNYIVFKVTEITYTTSIDIKRIQLKNTSYSGKKLKIKLDIDVEEGEEDPLRDWPLTTRKYVVMSVTKDVEKLYVNDIEYEKI